MKHARFADISANSDRSKTDVEYILNNNIGRLLRLAYRRFEVLALAHIRDMGFDGLRLTHLQLLPYIPASGIRSSEIAELANINKQAVGQLANELEAAGYLQRLPDPQDGRAKLLFFTPLGRRLLASYPSVIKRSEATLMSEMDQAEFAFVKAAVGRFGVAP